MQITRLGMVGVGTRKASENDPKTHICIREKAQGQKQRHEDEVKT